MKERPILFNGAMVRAILSGAKTQTRRVVKLDGITNMGQVFPSGRFRVNADGVTDGLVDCPFGVVGQGLWVRETWAKAGEVGDHTEYRADNPDPLSGRWRPSIHMPRWASRLSLTITDVRVQRLQDISEADAEAEGFDCRDLFACTWVNLYGPKSWLANPWVWAITFTKDGAE